MPSQSADPTVENVTPAPPTRLRVAVTAREAGENLAFVLLEHAALCAYWLIALLAPGGVWLLLVAPLACLLHQKAMSEWFHEAAHFNLAGSRPWNDRLANLLVAPVFFEDVETHRRKHFKHHARAGFFLPGDPDTASLALASRRDLWRSLLADLSGVTAYRAIAARGEPVVSERARRAAKVAMLSSVAAYVAFAALLTLVAPLGFLAVVVYVVVLCTLYPVFNRMRVYAQHLELAPDGRTVAVGSRTARTTRDRRFPLLHRMLADSRVMLFHHEHHAHPTLPFRQLERIAEARADINEYAESRRGLFGRLYRGLV